MQPTDWNSPVILAAIAGAIGATVAACVASAIGAFNLWLQRRSDERRQIRELAVKVALENWTIYKDFAITHGRPVSPIDGYLIHASHLVSALDGSLKTPSQIRNHLRASFSAADAASEEIKQRNETIRARNREDIG